MDCIICAYPFDAERLYCYGACGHSDVCSICFLRMRALQRSFSCPSCKTQLDHVICSTSNSLAFNQFEIWGDSIGPDFSLDQKSAMFFPKEYQKTKVDALWTSKCKLCRVVKRDTRALRAHMNAEHNMQMCNLCIDNRNSFPSEHVCFTQSEYEKHLRNGGDDGSEGHPYCEFCRRRYFDKTALFTHLTKDHYNCHICTRQGIRYKYYNDYPALDAHFRADHFVCEEPQCLAKKFVVFGNAIDLAAHSLQYHPTAMTTRSIPVNFKYRRQTGDAAAGGRDEGADGTARDESSQRGERGRSQRFEGGMGGRADGGEWQVELAYTPTDPRDEARSTSVPMDFSAAIAATSPDEEAFPTLAAGAGGSRTQQQHAMWAYGAVTTMGGNGNSRAAAARERDFPSLAGGTNDKNSLSGWVATTKNSHKIAGVSGNTSKSGSKGGGGGGTKPPDHAAPAPAPGQLALKPHMGDASTGSGWIPSGNSAPAPAPTRVVLDDSPTLAEAMGGVTVGGAKKAPKQVKSGGGGGGAGGLGGWGSALKDMGVAVQSKARRKVPGIAVLPSKAVPRSRSSSDLPTAALGPGVANMSLENLKPIGKMTKDDEEMLKYNFSLSKKGASGGGGSWGEDDGDTSMMLKAAQLDPHESAVPAPAPPPPPPPPPPPLSADSSSSNDWPGLAPKTKSKGKAKAGPHSTAGTGSGDGQWLGPPPGFGGTGGNSVTPSSTAVSIPAPSPAPSPALSSMGWTKIGGQGESNAASAPPPPPPVVVGDFPGLPAPSVGAKKEKPKGTKKGK